MLTQTQETCPAVLRNGTDDVVRAVVALIQERELKVGDKLPAIRQLATRLDVKPTVVRDALLQAQTMGLIQILPRSGAYVRSLTYAPLVEALASTLTPALMQEDHNLFHLLDARRLLETELVRRGAERRRLEDLLPARNALREMVRAIETDARVTYLDNDVRFHVEIACLGGNSVLCTIHQAVLDLLRPHLAQAQFPLDSKDKRAAMRSHEAIYAAMVDGDAEKASDETRKHLSLAYDTLLRDVAQPSG